MWSSLPLIAPADVVLVYMVCVCLPVIPVLLIARTDQGPYSAPPGRPQRRPQHKVRRLPCRRLCRTSLRLKGPPSLRQRLCLSSPPHPRALDPRSPPSHPDPLSRRHCLYPLPPQHPFRQPCHRGWCVAFFHSFSYSYSLPGTGSGSFTHSVARSIGASGHLWSYEFHELRANKARSSSSSPLLLILTHIRDELSRHAMTDRVTLTHRNVCKHGFTVQNTVDSGMFPSPILSLSLHPLSSLS